MLRLLASVVLAGTVFSFVLYMPRCSRAEGANETAEPVAPKNPWQTIRFTGERKLTAVRLVLKGMKASPWGDTGIAGNDGIDIMLRDPMILRTIQEGFAAPVTWGIPDDSTLHVSAPGYRVGTIQVSATDGEFEIGICTGGFFIQPQVIRMCHAFYSWPLAKQIDDVVYDETKSHLPLDVFRMLSGEWIVPAQRRQYYWMRQNHLIKQYQKIEAGQAPAHSDLLQKQGLR